MTEYELVDATTSFAEGAMGAISLYLTILTAYMIAAFFVGERLSRGEMIMVSGVFIVTSLLFTYVTGGFLIRQMYFAEKVADIEADAFIPVGYWLPIIIVSIELLGILVGLKFMWDIRNRKMK